MKLKKGLKMNKSEEIYLRSQLTYLKGKVEVYENLLYSNNILKRPRLLKFNSNGDEND